MSKTKLERIASYDEEIKQIQKRKQQLRQQHNKQERKDRTKRLCSRHGLLEKMLPEIITITDEQYQTFLEKAVTNNYGRDILNKIIAQGNATTAKQNAGTASKASKTANAETAQIKIVDGEDESENEDGGGKPTRA